MNKLTVKDAMTIGVFGALYFLFVGLGTYVGVVVLHSGNMMLAPACTALFAGTVYLVLVAKVRKFGAITIVGVMMALFFLLSGHFLWSFIQNLLFGVAADWVAKLGGYRSRVTNLLSYIVFSFGNLGPILLMWVAKEAYIARLLEKGKDWTYINNVMVPFSAEQVFFLIGSVVVCGVIGGLFGHYMVRKHFEKAGLVS